VVLIPYSTYQRFLQRIWYFHSVHALALSVHFSFHTSWPLSIVSLFLKLEYSNARATLKAVLPYPYSSSKGGLSASKDRANDRSPVRVPGTNISNELYLWRLQKCFQSLGATFHSLHPTGRHLENSTSRIHTIINYNIYKSCRVKYCNYVDTINK